MLDPQDLAVAIRRLRGDRTQKEVAAQARLDPTVWSLYEGGERFPRRDSFLRVARGLGVPVEELEEEMWSARRRRLRREGSEADDGGNGNDPLRHQVRGHLDSIHRHLEELVMLVVRERD